jgi:hypothetical protein
MIGCGELPVAVIEDSEEESKALEELVVLSEGED